MTWKDRLKKTASYRSPNGTTIPFRYTDLEIVSPARGKVFEFAGFNGGYGQRRGRGPRRFPMKIFVEGPEYDLLADALLAALEESGIGKLNHPLYGQRDVIVFGDISRKDRVVSGANLATFDVLFIESIRKIFPLGVVSPEANAAALLLAYQAASAGGFGRMNLKSQLSRSNVISKVKSGLNKVSSTLGTVSASVGKAGEFQQGVKLLNSSLDTLVGQPLALAGQIQRTILAPGKALASLKARLEGYANAFRSMFDLSSSSSSDSSTVPSIRTRVHNDFATADLFAGACLAGAVESVLATQFSTRTEAQTAALGILDLLEEYVEWRDERQEEIGAVDPGDSIQALEEATAITAGAAIQLSFSLRPERRVTLTRARTIIDLAAELYQSVSDETLDLLVTSNKLPGSAILEIPKGRTIVYYP